VGVLYVKLPIIKIEKSRWTHHHLETEEIELIEKLKLPMIIVVQKQKL
jgi:hypothetical protein